MVQMELLTSEEAARLLRLSVHTIRQWTFRRKLPAVRVGRKVLFRRDDLMKLIDRSYQPTMEKED